MTVESAIPNQSVRAVTRTLDILQLLDELSEPVTLTGVVSATGLPKTSAFRYLSTLEQRGFIERTPNGGFVVARTGASSRTSVIERVSQVAKPLLVQLRDEFDETVSIAGLESRRMPYLVTVKTRRAVRSEVQHGYRDMIHCTAFGKALAVNLPEKRVRRMLSSDGMPRFTKKTITRPGRYFSELAHVRQTGYAVNNEESEDGARCIAWALHSVPIPLAVTLSAPSERMPFSRVHTVVASLREFDTALSREMS